MIWAYIRRWWHALTHLHQECSAAEGHPGNMRTIWIGCSCGETFFGKKPTWFKG